MDPLDIVIVFGDDGPAHEATQHAGAPLLADKQIIANTKYEPRPVSFVDVIVKGATRQADAQVSNAYAAKQVQAAGQFRVPSPRTGRGRVVIWPCTHVV